MASKQHICDQIPKSLQTTKLPPKFRFFVILWECNKQEWFLSQDGQVSRTAQQANNQQQSYWQRDAPVFLALWVVLTIFSSPVQKKFSIWKITVTLLPTQAAKRLYKEVVIFQKSNTMSRLDTKLLAANNRTSNPFQKKLATVQHKLQILYASFIALIFFRSHEKRDWKRLKMHPTIVKSYPSSSTKKQMRTNHRRVVESGYEQIHFHCNTWSKMLSL